MVLPSVLIAAVVAAGPDDSPMRLIADSLPRVAGEAVVPGLRAPVVVERDARGVPVIRGEQLDDVIRGQGFVLGQERFLQMDLGRRFAAGRLSELLGASTAAMDREHRRYRLEHVADEVLARMPADVYRLLEVYAEGVNVGLADLAAPPPAYALLHVEPEPWRPRDTLLVNFAMATALHKGATLEPLRAALREALPGDLAAFLTPETNRFGAPLLPGPAGGPDPEYRPMLVPGPDVVDLRRHAAGAPPRGLVEPDGPVLGSNNWAVAARRSAHGGAILANDPHLQITVPGVWYRVQLEWGGHRVVGVSLPGTPGVVIGSNGHLAWGFTNMMGDFQDLVRIEVDPHDPARYRTPDGFEPFEEIVEEIRVAGEAPRRVTLRLTRWGVVTDETHSQPLVLEWTMLDPEHVNMNVLRLMTATDLETGLTIARGWYGPAQNVLLADDRGRIAWTVSGFLPHRVGFDGTVPVSWAEAGVGWDGALDERFRPQVVDPPEGMLFTANNRTVNVAWADRLGHAWDFGARARRIADLLGAKEKLDEEDMRRMQLDTRVEIFDFYRDLLLEATADARPGSLRAHARDIVRDWNGTADADQAGMRILNAWRSALQDAIIGPLVAPCRDLDPGFHFRGSWAEEPVRRILEERPAHLLPAGRRDYAEVLDAALDETLDALAAGAPGEGLARPWGEDNVSAFRHPAARVMPALGPILNMPDVPLSGHPYAIRVARRAYGASMRMVVSPGREQLGMLQTPAGQSGHPLSPNYRSSHPDWLEGRRVPLLAGAPMARLVLVPE